MIVKDSASIDGCRAGILRGLISIEHIFTDLSLQLVVTSGSEHYEHQAHRSAHYRGDAADVRSRTVGPRQKALVLGRIKDALGPDYVVILENEGEPNEHFHIHWSPIFDVHGSD